MWNILLGNERLAGWLECNFLFCLVHAFIWSLIRCLFFFFFCWCSFKNHSSLRAGQIILLVGSFESRNTMILTKIIVSPWLPTTSVGPAFQDNPYKVFLFVMINHWVWNPSKDHMNTQKVSFHYFPQSLFFLHKYHQCPHAICHSTAPSPISICAASSEYTPVYQYSQNVWSQTK